MTKAGLNFWFAISLFLLMPMGLALLGLWIRRIYRPLVAKMRARGPVDFNDISWQTLYSMLPGLLAFALFSLPLIYFNHQRNQWNFCLRVVQDNPGIDKTDSRLTLPCSCFDLDEVLTVGKSLER